MRQLIVNADDFGLTPGVNQGIADAHTRGVLTATTLMANSPAFDDAVRVATGLPSLSVGCHVVLLDGEPVLPPEQVPTLLKKGTRHFRTALVDFALAVTRGQLAAEEVEAEATAQIRKVQAAGIRVSHVDSHKHSHVFPSITKALARAAVSCGVRCMRKPFSPAMTIPGMELTRRPYLWSRFAAVQVLRGFEPDFRKIVQRNGIITPEASFGIVITGHYDFDLFAEVMKLMPEGTFEFVCHPGYLDPALAAMGTQLRSSRPRELEVLTSCGTRELFEELGIQPISFWDLQRQADESLPHGVVNPTRLAPPRNGTLTES